VTSEPGEGRRDLRQYTESGALSKSHKKKKGCPLTLLILVALPVGAVWSGWTLAATLLGGAT
jgi:hypothetical protein